MCGGIQRVSLSPEEWWAERVSLSPEVWWDSKGKFIS